MLTFKNLRLGQTFDWIDDENPTHNSYYHRCVKTGSRTYESVDGGQRMRVGSINAKVFHVAQESWQMAQ